MIAGAELLPVLMPAKPASTKPANEVAKKITGRDYISWSAISTFRTCPLKSKFRYIDGLPEESVSSALIFGAGIHSAVEQHFQAILSGDPKPDIEALLFAYRSAWLPHDPDAIQFGSSETRASLDALAARMLMAFLNSPAASVRRRSTGSSQRTSRLGSPRATLPFSPSRGTSRRSSGRISAAASSSSASPVPAARPAAQGF